MTQESGYRVVTSLYANGEHKGVNDVGIRPDYASADALRSSYFLSLVAGGGKGTWSRAHNEYKVVMPDGWTEYVRIEHAESRFSASQSGE